MAVQMAALVVRATVVVALLLAGGLWTMQAATEAMRFLGWPVALAYAVLVGVAVVALTTADIGRAMGAGRALAILGVVPTLAYLVVLISLASLPTRSLDEVMGARLLWPGVPPSVVIASAVLFGLGAIGAWLPWRPPAGEPLLGAEPTDPQPAASGMS